MPCAVHILDTDPYYLVKDGDRLFKNNEAAEFESEAEEKRVHLRQCQIEANKTY